MIPKHVGTTKGPSLTQLFARPIGGGEMVTIDLPHPMNIVFHDLTDLRQQMKRYTWNGYKIVGVFTEWVN